jgi:hypothetical protein
MKRLTALFALVLSTSLSYSQILITDFAASDFSATNGTFTITLQPTSSNLTGADNNSAQFVLSSPSPDLGGYLSAITLTGTLNPGSTAVSRFEIQLYDAAENYYRYQALWSSFTVGVQQTVTLSYVGSDLSGDGSFDNIVTGFVILTGGTGSASINFTANSLTAVPEPSVYALLIVGAGVVFFLRRVRRA